MDIALIGDTPEIIDTFLVRTLAALGLKVYSINVLMQII